MSNKQSSVEWFAQESWKLRVELEDEKISMGEYANKYYQLKEQAKAMHKEEITQAWKKGDGEFDNVAKQMSLEYYAETFGGNDEQQ